MAHAQRCPRTPLPDGVLKSRPVFLKKGGGRNVVQLALLPNRLEGAGEIRHVPMGKATVTGCGHQMLRPEDSRSHREFGQRADERRGAMLELLPRGEMT